MQKTCYKGMVSILVSIINMEIIKAAISFITLKVLEILSSYLDSDLFYHHSNK